MALALNNRDRVDLGVMARNEYSKASALPGHEWFWITTYFWVCHESRTKRYESLRWRSLQYAICIVCEGKTPLGKSLNLIWWRGFSYEAPGSEVYHFNAITPRSTLTWTVTIWLSQSFDQIVMFKKYSYLIGPYARKKKLYTTTQNM